MPEYATDRYITKLREQAKARGPLVKFGTINAYVNWGRWVADCLNCNGAALVKPGVEMVCGGLIENLADPMSPTPCQATFQVLFPSNVKDIERLLAPRPPANQNWKNEDLADLLGENIAAGLEK